MPAPTKHASLSLPFLVAFAAWIFPGAGYLLIKQRARGITIGLTVLVLFFSGLLIGGVRCLEVPGYDAHGNPVSSSHPVDEVRAKPWNIPQFMVGPIDILCDWWSVSVARPDPDSVILSISGKCTGGSFTLVYNGVASAAITYSSSAQDLAASIQAALTSAPINLKDIKVNPASADTFEILYHGSSDAALVAGTSKLDGPVANSPPVVSAIVPMIGSRSHSRVNELGILYTAIAGMLNLLAIIDSSHRATLVEAK